MTSVLACDPDELQVTAQALRRAAAELSAASGEVRGAGDASWTGLAAFEQTARRQEAADLVGRLGPPLEQIAGALGEVAAAAREHGGAVRQLSVRREEVVSERARLLALGPPSDPVAAVHWDNIVALVEEELARLRRSITAAEEEFDRAQRRAAGVVTQVQEGVPQIIWDLSLTVITAKEAFAGWRQVDAARSMSRDLGLLRGSRGQLGERSLHRVRERVAHHRRLLKMDPPGWISKVPGGAAVAARAVPVAGLADAGATVWTGGGYDGWRGGVSRGLAGVAVVGLVAVVAAPAAVTVGAAGLTAAAVYQAWMTGNWVYDNREKISRTVGRAWAGGRSVVSRGWTWGREAVGQARERAASGLARLRERRVHATEGRSEQGGLPVAPGIAPVAAPVGAQA